VRRLNLAIFESAFIVAEVMFQAVSVSRLIAVNAQDARHRLRSSLKQIQTFKFSTKRNWQRETYDLRGKIGFVRTNWFGATTEGFSLQRIQAF
jgi:hypothetical protein